MRTLLQQIQDAARRIDRLGQYASSPQGRSVRKDKGILYMSSGPAITFMPVCEPRTGRVWLRVSPSGTFDKDVEDNEDFPPDRALQWLIKFEGEILAQAVVKAEREVITELVAKKIRSIVRRKSRGFKADQKKRKRAK